MKRFISIVTATLMLLVSCQNILEYSVTDNKDAKNLLSIKVRTDTYTTKDVNLSNALPDGSSIGLFMRNVDPNDLYQHDLRNFKFTATSNEEEQLWQPEHAVYLNNELCSIHAYYPYDEDVSDVTAIPVTTAEQTDYMYAGNTIEVNTDNHTATIEMEHALSVITLNIKRGTYTGTGSITKVGLNGNGIAQAAQMNAETGKFHDYIGVNSMITQNVDLTMDEAGQYVHTLVIPNGETSPVRITLWVDGNEYYVVTPGTQFEQGVRYEYTLTIDQDEMGISNVHIGDWGYNGLGEPILWIGNHSVTFNGDYKDIAFSTDVNNSTLIIKACGLTDGSKPKEVSTSAGTISQYLEGYIRTIKITDINCNVIITFNGTIPNYWRKVPDGVYAISTNNEPVTVSEATSDCIAVGLVNSVLDQYLMIEKNEDNNMSYQQSYSEYGVSNTNYYYFYWGISGSTMNNLLDVQDFISYRSANETYSSGHLPTINGNYAVSSNPLGFPESWPKDDSKYVLANKSGYQQSQYLMLVPAIGEYTDYPPMCQLLKTFLASEDALGYSDWFIPTCMQLALLYVYKTEINEALSKIGGKEISTDYYWSSSEWGAALGWYIYFATGDVSWGTKTQKHRIRLVRNI